MQNYRSISDEFIECAHTAQRALCANERPIEKFAELFDQSSNNHEQFECFLEECCAKSEMCQYLQVSQRMIAAIKHAVASDQEGNFSLHIAAVETSLPIFRKSDCINYFRCGMCYLETKEALEATHLDDFSSSCVVS